MSSSTSKTARPKLRVRRASNPQEVQDLVNELASVHAHGVTMQRSDGGEIAHQWNVAANRQEWFVGGEWIGEGGTTLREQAQRQQITVIEGTGGGGGTNDHEQLSNLLGGWPWPGEHYHFTQYHHTELGRFAQWPGFTDAYMQAGFLQQLTVAKAATGADRMLILAKNTSAANTNYASIQVENATTGHAGVLAQFGTNFALVPQFADKTVLFSAYDSGTGIGSKSLALLAGQGAIEFWLYKEGSPSSGGGAYHEVADVRCTDLDVGFLPGLDSTFVLGSENWSVALGETGPLRWKDLSTIQAHINSHLVTCEGATVLGQDYSTDGTVQFGTLTLNNQGLHLLDTNASHDLIIAPGSDLTADRILTITTGDAARLLSLLGDLTVEAASAINQDLTTDAAPTFAGILPLAGTNNLGSVAKPWGTVFFSAWHMEGTAFLDLTGPLYFRDIDAAYATRGSYDSATGNFYMVGEGRFGSFRVDQVPAAGTITPDKVITISCNGVNYEVAVKAA